MSVSDISEEQIPANQAPDSRFVLTWLDSTRLVIVIITQNIGIRLEVESNIGPLFDLLFDTPYWPNINFFG